MGPNVSGRADDQVFWPVRYGRELEGGIQRACGFEVGGWTWVGVGPGCAGGSVWNYRWGKGGWGMDKDLLCQYKEIFTVHLPEQERYH